MVHTPHGTAILDRFLRDVCGLPMDWSAASVVEEQIRRIREQVGDGRVICGLSGGVDSSVAALLTHRAVGDQLTCVFIDHGLMRLNEGEQVVKAFRDQFEVPLVAVDAEERFLARLAGVTDPEAKRKAIGSEFIRCFEEEAAKLGNPKYLVQGTLYSDVIESGGERRRRHDQVAPQRGRAARGPGVRAGRAAAAGCSRTRSARWAPSWGCRSGWSGASPSRAPGLAIRIVGDEVNRERLDVLRAADFVLQDEIRQAGLYRDLWQSFCVLPAGVRAVGVQGDGRSYGHRCSWTAELAEGLRAAVSRAHLPARVDARALARYPPEVEATVYFCCLEAVQNVAKHAGPGARAKVRVWEEGEGVRFEVMDDGHGFDADAAPRGAGLANMSDRVGALGGRLTITASPGRGTRVAGTVPLEE